MSPSDRPLVTLSDAEPDLLGRPEPVERVLDWRAVLTTAIGVVGVAVAGTGIAVAFGLAGGGPQPEDALPADVFAMARIDLDPAANQKVAAYALAKRFPELGVDGAREVGDDLLRTLFKGQEQVDYDKQVRPWIGSRAAVAGAPDADGDGVPELLVAVAYEDREAAERALPDLLDEAADGAPAFFAFSSQAPYVLLALNQAAADAAADPSAVLADAPGYRSDLEALDGDQVAVAWADLGALWSAAGDEAREAAALAYGPEIALSGRAVLGLHLEPDELEVSGQAAGVDLGNSALTAYALGVESGGGLVEQLPAGTVAALSVAGLDQQVQNLFEVLATGVVGPGGSLPEQDLALVEEQLGVSVPDDVALLLGQETALAVFADGEQPQVGARSRGADPEAALAVAQRLLTAASEGFGVFGGDYTLEQCLLDNSSDLPDDLSVEDVCSGLPAAADLPAAGPVGVVGPVDGGVVFGTTQEVLERMTGPAGLGDSEVFRRAVPDAGDAAGVAYADLQALVPILGLSPQDAARIAPLEAIGVTSAGGPDSRFRMRLTLR